MYEFLLVLDVIVAVLLIGLILLQQGKGAQAGAAFGSGASQTVFGSQGSGGFLSRATGILATLFFILSLFLAYWVNKTTARPTLPIKGKESEQHAPAQVPVTSSIPLGEETLPEKAATEEVS